MAAYSKVWYLERFHLLDVLTPEKKRYFAGRTIMKDIKRGERISSVRLQADQAG